MSLASVLAATFSTESLLLMHGVAVERSLGCPDLRSRELTSDVLRLYEAEIAERVVKEVDVGKSR